jgi:predicted transcriptional regulator
MPTYHLTLALIQQGSSVEEIMKNRDFVVSTVLGHINKLVEENLISDVQRRTNLSFFCCCALAKFFNFSLSKNFHPWNFTGFNCHCY